MECVPLVFYFIIFFSCNFHLFKFFEIRPRLCRFLNSEYESVDLVSENIDRALLKVGDDTTSLCNADMDEERT